MFNNINNGLGFFGGPIISLIQLAIEWFNILQALFNLFVSAL